MSPTTRKASKRIDWHSERDRVDLAAVAARLLGPAAGRRGDRGRKLWWSCPLGTHEDRNPSFCVEPGKPRWKCYGCSESGDAANLVMRVESVTFPEALAYLTAGPARARPRRPRKTSTRPASRTPSEPSGMPEADALALVEESAARLWTPVGAEALSYLTGPERVLSPDTLRAARLGWTPRAEGVAWNPPGVVIPWFAGGRLAMVKVRPDAIWRRRYRDRFPDRKPPPKYLEAFRDPARLACYPGPEAIRPGLPLVIVEGEFDTLVLGEAIGGLAGVVTLGSASTEPTPSILGRFLTAAPWYLAMDNDPAGGLAAAKWQAYGRARFVRLPPRYKDWTEAGADGVNLGRWWADRIAGRNLRQDGWGDMAPELFTDEEAATWRWSSGTGDEPPGILSPCHQVDDETE